MGKRNKYFKCLGCGKETKAPGWKYKRNGAWCNSCLRTINANAEKRKKGNKDDFYARLLLKNKMEKEYIRYKKLKNKISADEFC